MNQHVKVAGRGVNRRDFVKGSAAAAVGLMVSLDGRLSFGAPAPLILDVRNVPVPDFTAGNRHPGVETLLRALACSGVYFYKADSSFPLSDPVTGIIAPDDTVLIKVNGQWRYRGVTNSDVVRGVIQRILDHPLGFTGEVVIVENGQGVGSLNCDKGWPGTYSGSQCHANAEDETHSFQYLIDQVFTDPRVTGYLLDTIRTNWIANTEHVAEGYRQVGLVSYPCFTTARGTRVELRDGIWDGAAHQPNLKLLNIPVYKTHGGSGTTGALKHMYGLLSTDRNSGAYHYSQFGNASGDMHSIIRTPDLNIVDCIWVSPGELAGFPEINTSRTNRLLAGFDPVALDYFAAKYILMPAGTPPSSYHDPDAPGDLRNGLTQARDRINTNGGLRGEDVTFDESLFRVVTAALVVTRQGNDALLEWRDGSPPFSVWRSESRNFAAPELLTNCCMQRTYTDAGSLLDARSFYYRIE